MWMTFYCYHLNMVSLLESLVIGCWYRRLKFVLKIGICVKVKEWKACPLLYGSDVVGFDYVRSFGR